MKLLQLGALELDQYVQEAVEANPLLEFPSEVTGPAWQETDQEVYRGKRVRDKKNEPLPDPLANASRQKKTLQQLIRQTIQGEDKRHPLSDQAICEALERQGIHTARRTVNKYRVKMGIPAKSGRKEWE